MRLHPVVGIALAVGLACCGGAVYGDAWLDAASGPGDGAPEDVTLPQDSAGDALSERAFPEGSAPEGSAGNFGDDAVAVSEDASLGDAQQDASEEGAPLYSCNEDAAVDGGCACWYGDAQSWCTVQCSSLIEQPCGPIGMRCGSGCGIDCVCRDGGWWCIAPPCLPP